MFRSAFRSLGRQAFVARRNFATGSRQTGSNLNKRVLIGTGLMVPIISMVAFQNTAVISNDDEKQEKIADFSKNPNEAEPEKPAKKEVETKTGDDSNKDRSAAKSGQEDSQEGDESAGGAAAYNPETGEINWDCPCLGGMAHGPCGEEFKEAFACFVYSETEPKGIDCIKKFENMRTCFKQHPEHYKEELYDDEVAEEQGGDKPASEGGAPDQKESQASQGADETKKTSSQKPAKTEV
ncbi:Piso0_000193 [Millerozyma farinosa CBS 7064]|uniref:Mitochondrial intermembrane space import and assembly protein 40 n=1 Tax=Pichia sorbitophila (strain ATCC MYA-4447 / BCRC 22081 / CBS 7064 / NBRC 10061 / NRRL Y-12695) TaxID=559304 RepID=G8YUS3_PICSO|nr:Piso0_000193 [Millerozyma farinosa CBS 7064]